MGELRVGVDVGGTFTDLVAVDTRSGETIALKVSSTPKAPEEGVLTALRVLFERLEAKPDIAYLAHSTTIATNALLGQMHLELPRVVFLTTEGFRDVIEIGRQNRSEVYNLFVHRPTPLVTREDRIAVAERMDYRGNVLRELDDAEIERAMLEVRSRQPQAIAIGFLHAYKNDMHERRVAEACARAFPGVPVTRSSEVNPEYREYERFSTTVVNAALLPIVRGYLERLATGLLELGVRAPLFVMQSNGGMAAAAYAAQTPASILESGPASGVIGAADLSRTLGLEKALSFDMGGTTAKAGTIVGGVVQVVGEFEAAGSTHSGRSVKGSGYPVRFPFVDLAEVSAGGGTVAWIDDAGSLRVGPVSAGADPGPACYGKSERATVTDANVVLGRLNPKHLAGGAFPIDGLRSRVAIGVLAEQLQLSVEATAEGIVRLVDSEMAKVLRIVTVERGLDPREFSIVAFGGNGPLHACSLADELEIRRIVVPRHPGVFSAQGLLVADVQATFVRPLLVDLSTVTREELDTLFDELASSGRAALTAQGAAPETVQFRRSFDARYRGQSFEIEIADAPDMAQLRARFDRSHAQRYGYAVEGEAVELVNARLNAFSPTPAAGRFSVEASRALEAGEREAWIEDRMVAVPVFERDALVQGESVRGPALIEQYDSVTYVSRDWTAHVEPDALVLERR